MTTAIFISYRRSDSQGWAGHLLDALTQTFGADVLFFDMMSIEPGEDFARKIDRALLSAGVVLALIGPGWLAASVPDGRRRLEDEADFVRIELATSLRREVRLVPILLGGATMPKAADLPDDLKALTGRQALDLTDQRWDYDFERLIQTIEAVTGRKRLVALDEKHAGGISVGARASLEEVEAGDVAGIKTSEKDVPALGHGSIDVFREAEVKKSKVGDIVGIKVDGRPANDK